MRSLADTSVSWFIEQLRPLLPWQILGLLCTVLGSLLFLLDPLIIKWLIDKVIPAHSLALLTYTVACFLMVYVFRVVLAAASSLINVRVVQKLTLCMRTSLLQHMNRLSASYHDGTPVGERMFRLEQDVDQIAEISSNVLPYALQTLFNVILVSVAMLILNRRLTLAMLPIVALFAVARRHFDPKLRRVATQVQLDSSGETAFLQEHLTSIVQLQLLNREDQQAQAFANLARTRSTSITKRASLETGFRMWCMGAVAAGTTIVLWYGTRQVFVGALTVGGLIAFYSYLARLFDPVNAAVNIYSQVSRLTASLRRIHEITQTFPDVLSGHSPLSIDHCFWGNIAFLNVAFSYSREQPLLNCVSLSLTTGDKIALVGPSGCGKSTIAKLIARLYDPTHGAVEIDGTDIRQLQLVQWRQHVCYVMQEPVLFDLTVRENLLLVKPHATDEELQRVLEITELIRFLERLPDGWDTRVGPRATFLSGGERQRLALARALLVNSPVMILDEATSAVDVPTEQRILARLRSSFPETTMVFISHRLSSLEWAGRILVLNHGTIEEMGTHTQLLKTGTLYRSLCDSSHASTEV